jgi:uncharacterized protein (TIGR03067 family)
MQHDLNQLQGKWMIASLDVDGAAVPAGALNGAAITVTDNRFTTTSMGAEYSGRIELNAASNPRTLTMHFESGPEAGNTNHGIYEIHSGQWRLCLNMQGGAAPSEFKTAAGSGYALETLVRPTATPIAATPLDDSPREAVPELQGQWAMISCVRSGQALPAPFIKSGKRTITGTQSTLHFGPQLYMQGHLSRDAGDPNFIKLEHTAGEAQGTTQLGIFELNGASLKTCFATAGMARPALYASSAEGGETFAVWKRIG